MGESTVSSFMKAYFIPGMGHSFANGTSNSNANVALPTNQEMYQALTNWGEKGIQPSSLTAYSETKDRSLPICVYPQKLAIFMETLIALKVTCIVKIQEIKKPNILLGFFVSVV